MEVFNGLGNRVLWACVRRSKVLPFGGSCDRPGSPGWQATWLWPYSRPGTSVQRWSDSGRKLWEAEYGRLTEDRPGLWGAITSRAEAHVLRLAMILSSWTWVPRSRTPTSTPRWQSGATAIAAPAYLFQGSLGDRDADAILAALRARPGGMTRTEISGDVFGRNCSASALDRALGKLLKSPAGQG